MRRWLHQDRSRTKTIEMKSTATRNPSPEDLPVRVVYLNQPAALADTNDTHRYSFQTTTAKGLAVSIWSHSYAFSYFGQLTFNTPDLSSPREVYCQFFSSLEWSLRPSVVSFCGRAHKYVSKSILLAGQATNYCLSTRCKRLSSIIQNVRKRRLLILYQLQTEYIHHLLTDGTS